MFFRRHSNHRIVTAACKRMAAQNADDSHPSATQSTVALDGLHGIFGAGRHVTASRRQHGRDRPFVGAQQLQHDEFGELVQDRLPVSGFGPPDLLFIAASAGVRSEDCCDSFCSMTAKALVTSFSTTEKSMASKDFFGLITTSAATPFGGLDRRTASRKRRFMRLRCTAPPRTRPTVNPMRSPCGAGTPARFFAHISALPFVSGRGQ